MAIYIYSSLGNKHRLIITNFKTFLSEHHWSNKRTTKTTLATKQTKQQQMGHKDMPVKCDF